MRIALYPIEVIEIVIQAVVPFSIEIIQPSGNRAVSVGNNVERRFTGSARACRDLSRERRPKGCRRSGFHEVTSLPGSPHRSFSSQKFRMPSDKARQAEGKTYNHVFV